MKGKSRLYDNLATARIGARSESRWTVFNWDGLRLIGCWWNRMTGLGWILWAMEEKYAWG